MTVTRDAAQPGLPMRPGCHAEAPGGPRDSVNPESIRPPGRADSESPGRDTAWRSMKIINRDCRSHGHLRRLEPGGAWQPRLALTQAEPAAATFPALSLILQIFE